MSYELELAWLMSHGFQIKGANIPIRLIRRADGKTYLEFEYDGEKWIFRKANDTEHGRDVLIETFGDNPAAAFLNAMKEDE